MDDPFEYPADRSELFGETNEEEASFYFSLIDFKQLIDRYGVEFVFNRLDLETFDKIVDWLVDEE